MQVTGFLSSMVILQQLSSLEVQRVIMTSPPPAFSALRGKVHEGNHHSNLGGKVYFLTMWKVRAYLKGLAVGEIKAPQGAPDVSPILVFARIQAHFAWLATACSRAPPLPQVRVWGQGSTRMVEGGE